MKLWQEPYRPAFHITPASGWLNDPNGMIYRDGVWHVFYQFNPNKFPGETKYWDHVRSTDLVHWEKQPVALEPDRYGSQWSGSAIADEDNVSGLFPEGKGGIILFYTVTDENDNLRQRQCLAYSSDGVNFTKYNGGAPIITSDDDPAHHRDFRDPKVFWHEESGRYMMVVAGGPLRFFTSTDLVHWSVESYTTEIFTECPDFYKMEAPDGSEKWILSGGGVWYMIGDFKEVDGKWTFIPESGRKPYQYGQDKYAAQTFSGTDRRIQIQWMMDPGYSQPLGHITDPWNGALTLPVELTLEEEGGELFIASNPIPELCDLRMAKLYEGDVEDGLPEALSSDCFCLTMDVNTADCDGFTLALRKGISADGKEEQTLITFDSEAKTLTLDRAHSGKTPVDWWNRPMVLPLGEGFRHTIEIYGDRSSIDLFADGRLLTAQILPEPTSCGMSLEVNGRLIGNLSLWQMGDMH